MDAAAITAMGARLDALREALGPRAHVSLSVSSPSWGGGARAALSLWPDGIGRGDSRYFAADTFEAAMEQGEDAVVGILDTRRETTIRAMASRILEVTGDKGGCEEADLADSFSAEELRTLRDAAVRRAHDLARRMRAGLETVV